MRCCMLFFGVYERDEKGGLAFDLRGCIQGRIGTDVSDSHTNTDVLITVPYSLVSTRE